MRMMSWGGQSLKVEFHPGAGKNKRLKSATYSFTMDFTGFVFAGDGHLRKPALRMGVVF